MGGPSSTCCDSVCFTQHDQHGKCVRAVPTGESHERDRPERGPVLRTKVISATVRDATYVLDEILDNETELQVLEHATDTAGTTDLIFALFDLVGLQFSPRIRDLSAQRLYRPEDLTIPEPLDGRFRGRVNRTLIEAHWDDLLRVAGSLKRGYVTASLLVSKLQAYPRQNRLTRVL